MLEPHSAVCSNLYDIMELIEQCPSLCSILMFRKMA